MYPARFAIVSLLLCAACGVKTQYTPTNAPPKAIQARSPQSVVIYAGSQPAYPYVDIGIIKAHHRAFGDDSEVVPAMRKVAAQRGCDGLILQGSNNHVQGDRNGVTTLSGMWGTCIVWVPEPAPSPQAAEPAPQLASYDASPQAPATTALLTGTATPSAASHGLRDATLRELVREGISLDRLQLGLSLVQEGETGVWRVGLVDTQTYSIIAHEQVAGLPPEPSAQVAHLVIVVRRMVESNSQ